MAVRGQDGEWPERHALSSQVAGVEAVHHVYRGGERGRQALHIPLMAGTGVIQHVIVVGSGPWWGIWAR
jgi:hypothetical protein